MSVICINKAIKLTCDALNDELWAPASPERAKALQRRLNSLKRRRDNGEVYEVRF